MNPPNLTSPTFGTEAGFIPGCTQDKKSVTRDWQSLQTVIAGVRIREIRHVSKNNGLLTEIWRAEWQLDPLPVAHVFQNLIYPGGISGWHVHQFTTDRIFVNLGSIKIVLFDARKDSATCGQINEFRFGLPRPALVVVPPGVWHAVQNLGPEPAALLNLVDLAYDYERPDHWRLPLETLLIPYSFAPVKGAPGAAVEVL